MKFSAAVPIIICCLFSGCSMKNSTEQIPAVTGFDLKRYMGIWYEIARYPHSFEQGLSHVSAVYSLNRNGTVSVINRGIREDGTEHIVKGIAKPCRPAGSGELKVSFFRPFYGAYRIIYLSPDYDLAIVTSSTRNYLWFLSRTRSISPEQRSFLLTLAAKHGFDLSKLIFVDQNIPRKSISSLKK